MKKLLLTLCFFTILSFLGLSVYANGRASGIKKEIPTTLGPGPTGGGTSESDGIFRCPIIKPAAASIYDRTITVDFLNSEEDVMIVVTNLATGEIIFSESFVATDTAIFELNAEIGANCKIEIITESWSLEGEFSI